MEKLLLALIDLYHDSNTSLLLLKHSDCTFSAYPTADRLEQTPRGQEFRDLIGRR